METTNPKQLILQLILADLRSRKLLMGLEQAGLQPADFHTELYTLILGHMGFEASPDALHTWYEDTVDELLTMELPYFIDKQHDLAHTLYEKLVWKRLMEA